MKTNALNRFLLSYKFFLLLVVMQFALLPVATKGFQWEAVGDIITYTLQYALIQGMYPYTWIFQLVAIALLMLLVVGKGRFSRCFLYYGGSSYALYAGIQNVALTEQYGMSMVTVNVVMFLFVAILWFRSAYLGNTQFTFSNLSLKTAWTIPVAFFCLWWPMDKMGMPDLSPAYLLTGGSALAFCPMTPVFLTLLVLSKEEVDLVLLRVTAMVGFIIGCYNMGNFTTDTGFYLGLYHLPLLSMSLYVLLISRKKKNDGCV